MTGAGRLVRLILRRDRIIMPVWAVLLGLVPAGYVASFEGLFPTDAERIDYARLSATNTGFVTLYGPLHGSSLGELVAWRAGFLPVLAGLCALLTVIRHTRADEEAGRTELIGAAAVGRHAQLAAAVLTTCAAGLLMGVVLTAAMVGQGLPAAGSLAFGAEMTLSVFVFAGVGAVAAQLTSGARGARSIALTVLAAAFVLRVGGDTSAVGDGSLRWMSWLSPIGWVQHLFPYGVNDWWPALLALAFTVVTVAVAGRLQSRRDLGVGQLPARLGPASAPAGLSSPFGLAWRLHRGMLVAWTIGFALLGLIFGGVGASVLDIAAGNQGLSDVFTRLGGSDALVDSYFAGIASIVGLIAACYGVQTTLRMRDEEQTGHTEAVLTTSVSRYTWAGTNLFFALLGPAVVLAVEGLATSLTYPDGDLGEILGGVLVQLPAVWVLAGVAVLAFGLVPRLSAVAWAPPAMCLLVLLVGQTLQLDQWFLDISPFTHVPKLPGGDLSALPLVSLTVVAAALTAVGVTGLRRRNVPE
ncbi:ABC transporter permease [Actinoplanes sp. LDG1-06]|uniref:ABC transporter permease n=1 Tax=Paractinoplanes ovalisporus TaxID=2810368 RepID=A0ABS2AEH3_9ACTN|nr:ABC transporter permease [Actinoplanes ovalisporus]MBM2618238.1 ABC transporter permease [Actinoplanes ovalisporus]